MREKSLDIVYKVAHAGRDTARWKNKNALLIPPHFGLILVSFALVSACCLVFERRVVLGRHVAAEKMLRRQRVPKNLYARDASYDHTAMTQTATATPGVMMITASL